METMFGRGVDARRAGKARDANPCVEDSQDWHDWNAGWGKARLTDETRHGNDGRTG